MATRLLSYYLCIRTGLLPDQSGAQEVITLTTPNPSSDRITRVTAFPLEQRLPQPTKTSWGTYDRICIVMVRVETEQGHVGAGEVLARFAPRAYCELIDTALTPRLIGQDPSDIPMLWASMRRALSGRAGGVLVECIAGVDIALWDIRGKAAGLPLSALLSDDAATDVPVYAASINWAADDAAERQIDDFRAAGFDRMKIKIGHPYRDAATRAAFVRKQAGDAMTIYADANWAYAIDEAEYVGHALQDAGVAWFEEPLDPDDEVGFEVLARRLTIPLAAGESNFTAAQADRLISSGVLSFIQPNITRTGGVTETWKTVQAAQICGVHYAAHVGMSGIICETASLHLAAAAGDAAQVECAMPNNRFKSDLSTLAPGYARARLSRLDVPIGPGLGLDIDWDAVRAMGPA